MSYNEELESEFNDNYNFEMIENEFINLGKPKEHPKEQTKFINNDVSNDVIKCLECYDTNYCDDYEQWSIVA